MDESFGTLLRRRRRGRALTQQALAERSGLSVETIGALERGARRAPYRETVEQLAHALELDEAERVQLEQAARPSRQPVEVDATDGGWVAPAQLPAALADFTGRDEQVRTALAWFADGGPPGAPSILSIEGMAGVGKTALAVQLGRLLAERYPDGQLYLDLNGFNAMTTLSPLDALGALLRAVGEWAVPAEPAEASALFRSRVAGRRVLLVLDNAADAAQIDALIPAGAGCAVLVTSRRKMIGLAAARHLELDVLEPGECRDYLGSILGRKRLAAEPGPADALIELCGRLPLALGLAAARLRARPDWRIADLVTELGDEGARLERLEGAADRSVHAAFAVSIGSPVAGASLDDDARLAFPALGVVAAQDLSLPVGAAILDRPPQQAEAVLEALVDLHLLRSTSPERYQLHDLVQVYARTLAENRLSAAERTAILERVLCGYRRTGLAAIELSEPSSALLSWVDPSWLEGPGGFEDSAAAFEWLDRELATLRAVVRQATHAGGQTAQLVPGVVLSLVAYLMVRNDALSWCELLGDALALDLDDRVRAMLVMHRGMSEAIAGLRDEPVESFRESAELFRRSGDRHGEVAATGNLGQMLNRLERLDEAVEPIERALAINRELGNENQAAKTLRTLGNLFWMRGEHERGLETTEAALAYFRASGELWDIAMSLHILGEMRWQQSRHADAVDHLLEAAQLYRSIGHKSGLMEVLGVLADCHVECGAPDLAVPVFSEALALAEELGDPSRARRLGAALDAALERIEAAR